jgi:7,8-dihydroneopterin aldolase/epimerase/oxygenase
MNDSRKFAQRMNLTRARRIFFRDIEVQMFMGIHDFEQGVRQRVIINVDVYLAPPAQPLNDRIDAVVDYDLLKTKIIELALRGHYNLQETLCEKVLAACLDLPGVLAARVSSEKPDVYADCGAVGFEMFAVKES